LAERRAQSQRVHLVNEIEHVPVWVRGDPLLLREVVANLLFNAIDASPIGGVVRITCGSRAEGNFIRIADNGPGVGLENRERLFEPHFTTKEHGTGMGLFVSYGIIREHRGRLVYEGDKRGAVFTVVLPPAPAADVPTRPSQPV